MKGAKFVGLVIALLLVAAPGHAENAIEAYRAMGIATKDVLSGTTLSATVVPGEAKQLICVTTYFTGLKDKANAVNVRLDVFDVVGGQLTSIWKRDFGAERGGFVADGNLQLIDLDMDGVTEIIVSFDTFDNPLIDQTLSEVIVHADGAFRTAWAGPVVYDATRAAREIPLERRDRYRRDFDIPRTMKTRGLTLFIDKRVIAVAGEMLPQAKIVQETFPLRASVPKG
jgi:hypothetical protein